MVNFKKQLDKVGEFGLVEEVHHPIVTVSGLPGVKLREMVIFETGQVGEAFLLDRSDVRVLIFSKEAVRAGTKVTRTGQFLSVPVGKELLGKIIDPLGRPVSRTEHFVKPKEEHPVDTPPPGIDKRARIKEAFLTGVTIVDMMIPLGKGQKELVIGDRQTGKTAFLLAAIKNQVHMGSVAIYAGIAKSKSDLKKIQHFFEKEKVADKVIMVVSSAYDPPSLIYVTPYAAMTIAEYFRDQGQDTLLVLDDLSTHARFYREISLLARRFPGRDAYPGDIFYTHARLLERAGNFKVGAGKEAAITVLPAAELTEGDLTGFIPTNLMGMTDGHIFFDSNIYYRGRRPAVNISLSVTRVGRQSQSNLLRSINNELSAFFVLYEKTQNLSHFGAELTDAAKQILQTGDKVYNFFEQPYSSIVPASVQLVLFSLLWLGILEGDRILIDAYRQKLIQAYGSTKNKELLDEASRAASFRRLLDSVTARKEEILPLCKIES